jgi:hypothetical protein
MGCFIGVGIQIENALNDQVIGFGDPLVHFTSVSIKILNQSHGVYF